MKGGFLEYLGERVPLCSMQPFYLLRDSAKTLGRCCGSSCFTSVDSSFLSTWRSCSYSFFSYFSLGGLSFLSPTFIFP
ncbi:hypothetical protein CSUI_004993 [Cystoisospora suis]|uniref:Uncharacterized protein n=1 Tax=Cystoisospora suis TaxID=483139 RepID=A0A2C6KZ29_9APIC|nr:hypothetical protein CSUI_004993 [Cystoisospora suis]